MPLSKIVAKSITDNTITTDQIADTSVHGRRNLVINGAMEIDQRNATTTMGAVTYGLDRFTCFKSHDGVQTMVQSTDAPVGFKNSLKVTTTTADASLAAGQRSCVIYRVEAQDNAHLEFGTANAKKITLSFYVKSSITGTHGGAFGNGADNRNYPFTYTISSADTWERKIISISGDTTGTWATGTGRGLQIVWGLGVGSTYSGTAGAWAAGDINSATGATTGVTNTLNATWFLTGVQLEVGDKATPFEHRSFSEELQSCRRYFYAQQPKGLTSQATNDANCILGSSYGQNNIYAIVEFQTEMRVYPAVSSGGTWYARAGNNESFTGAFGTQRRGRNNYLVGQSAGNHGNVACLWCEPGNGSYLYFDAEL